MNAEVAQGADETAAKKRAPAGRSAVQTAVDKAKAALEDRVALINETARAQERVLKAEAKLAEEQRHYQSSYESSLAVWSKRELDGFGFRAPRRSNAAAVPTAGPEDAAKPRKKTAKKTTSSSAAAGDA